MSSPAVDASTRTSPLSSISSKSLVAVTGLGLVGFVIGHLVGNLQVYAGPFDNGEMLNRYAHWLKGNPELLWPARLGLLAIFLLHVYLTLRLRFENWAARPTRYVIDRRIQASAGSRTMVVSGLVILAFVLYHLAHFTLGLTHPEHFARKVVLHGEEVADVYAMVVLGFRDPLVSGLYIVSMVLLGLHLSHGIPSALQSLGLSNSAWAATIRKVGLGLTYLIVIGNISMPLTILLGLVGRNVTAGGY
jgi:succinate dehydrogenase / fumarate reductase cytochrome b subunit